MPIQSSMMIFLKRFFFSSRKNIRNSQKVLLDLDQKYKKITQKKLRSPSSTLEASEKSIKRLKKFNRTRSSYYYKKKSKILKTLKEKKIISKKIQIQSLFTMKKPYKTGFLIVLLPRSYFRCTMVINSRSR